MKYQIYLNKMTSDYINFTAKQENIKPNTLIKNMIEQIILLTVKQIEATGKVDMSEFNKRYGKPTK